MTATDHPTPAGRDADFGWIIWPFGAGRKQVGLCFTEGDPDVIFDVPTEQAETLDRIFSTGARVASLITERDEALAELARRDAHVEGREMGELDD